MMNTAQNCVSYWYPKIKDLVPTPKTTIIRTHLQLCPLLEGQDVPGFVSLICEIADAAEAMGFPVFMRTGQTSGKHEWVDTCFIEKAEVIGPHMVAIIEYSEMCSLIGLPYDVWVIREMLPTKPIGTAYRGMPVCREFRVFVDGSDVQCIHPYWPSEVFDGSVPEGYDEMCQLDSHERAWVEALAITAGKAVGGAWSVDVLATERGWYVTDMATAEDSWHWPECEKNPCASGEIPEGVECGSVIETLIQDKDIGPSNP